VNRIFPRNILPPSAGDKLLTNSFGAKIELLRCRHDDDEEADCIMQFEISGTIDNPADAKELLGALLREFNSPAAEGGEAHAS